jgi:hypothetical protein
MVEDMSVRGRETIDRGGLCGVLKLRQIGTQRVQMKGVLPLLVRLASMLVQKSFVTCPALAALVGPVQKYFFLTIHYLNSLVPIAQQSCSVAFLVMCASGEWC